MDRPASHSVGAATTPREGDILDVLIVGAGISGIGMAAHLRRRMPAKSWAIVEARDSIGGTWDLFRYPGVRSDSDLYTFAYDFKPWTGQRAIAGAEDILAYLRETVAEYQLAAQIRFGTRLVAADWSDATATWTVTVETGPERSRSSLRCRWLFGATGYYDYATGHSPQFVGQERFGGTLLHPQHWPQDLELAGRRVAIIGSGATAVTLVPALAGSADHVTQIQRTPSYVVAQPARDRLAGWLQRLLPAARAHAMARAKNVTLQRAFYVLCQRYPETMRRLIRRGTIKALPEGFDVDTHFNPPYGPWDQRLCVAPDGDYFAALRSGKADIVTGAIAEFTETGIRMADGFHVDADVVVMATGLKIQLFGGAQLAVNGTPVNPADHLVFRGTMLDGVPNFSFAVGYTTASWTLKIGLLCEYICRILSHMDDQGRAVCVPERPATVAQTRPLLDFGAGYVKRALSALPRQGDGPPWVMTFDYFDDARLLRRGSIDDPALKFSPSPATPDS